jgi:tetraacyldisaccharide 4'-kinase
MKKFTIFANQLKGLLKIVFKKETFVFWVEEYLFYPTSALQIFTSFLLYPLSIIYSIIVLVKRITTKKMKYPIPVVSIGNLTIGGSGKTPFLISVASEYENVAIISRGYGRTSKGLHVVSKFGKILCDIKTSGDEAMLFALSLPKAIVIVSEDRVKAINYACELGCRAVFLDDGFSKSNIEKFDILLRPEPEPRFNFTLPSGAYREPKFLYKFADIVANENIDFTRKVTLQNPTEKMLLVTAISKPKRLESYLPQNIIGKVYYMDHHMYTKIELEKLLKQYDASSILTTEKDRVKMKDFNLPLSILELHVEVNPDIKNKINNYLSDFR